MTFWAGLLCGPGLAAERDLIPPDPWEVIHTARTFGPADVGHDVYREPRIMAKAGKILYTISFYGCHLGRDCETILFQTRLAREEWEPDAEDIADWNGEKLFGRAWIEDAEEAVLDHPVTMGVGLPKSALVASFEAFLSAAEEFREHVDF